MANQKNKTSDDTKAPQDTTTPPAAADGKAATPEAQATAANGSPSAPPPPAPEEPAAEPNPVVSTCVVNRGRGRHVGNAVNGKVCSYHAMHYDANGKRR